MLFTPCYISPTLKKGDDCDVFDKGHAVSALLTHHFALGTWVEEINNHLLSVLIHTILKPCISNLVFLRPLLHLLPTLLRLLLLFLLLIVVVLPVRVIRVGKDVFKAGTAENKGYRNIAQ